MGTQIKGDFIGFSFGGVHSSTLGIIRTNNGSRYDKNLLPTIQDKTVQVPGGDGTYYFGSYYTQKPFSISIAYDNVTEDQIGRIEKLFGKKNPQKLIFDEAPYKYYWAKCTGTPNLKFICFGEKEDGTGRVYKGEGTLTFTCYDPYGYSVSRWVGGLKEEDLKDKDAWLQTSGLIDGKLPQEHSFFGADKNATSLDNIEFDEEGKALLKIRNGGQLETDWILYFSPEEKEKPMSLNMKIEEIEIVVNKLYPNINTNNDYFKIDSKLGIIQNLVENDKKPIIYNEFLMGTLSKLPLGIVTIEFSKLSNCKLQAFSFPYRYY